MVRCAVLAQTLQACPLGCCIQRGALEEGSGHDGSGLIARLACCWVPNLVGCWKGWKLDWKHLLYRFIYFVLPGKRVNMSICPRLFTLVSVTFCMVIW